MLLCSAVERPPLAWEKLELEKDEYERGTFKTKEEPPEVLNLDKTLEEFKNEKQYKFVYLVYAVNKRSKHFSPYNFKIVPFENINKRCFFTLSTEGMMSHIQNEVRFTSFARFEEDYRNYRKLMQVSRTRFTARRGFAVGRGRVGDGGKVSTYTIPDFEIGCPARR